MWTTVTTAREVVLQFLWRPTSEARRRQNLSWGLSALPAKGICLTCLRMAPNEKDQRRGARRTWMMLFVQGRATALMWAYRQRGEHGSQGVGLSEHSLNGRGV